MADIDRVRFKNQSGIIEPEKLTNTKFLIIGAGAIGSFTALTLAKMGATQIEVYDDDTIEEHNVANQLYPAKIGAFKAETLAQIIKEYTGVEIIYHNAKWTNQEKTTLTPDVVISAVDSMTIRQFIWNWVTRTETVKYFVDGRMGAQVLRAYAISMENPEQTKFYEKTLYSSAEALPARCAEKSIIYTVNLVAGVLVSQIKKLVNGDSYSRELVYDVVNDVLVATK